MVIREARNDTMSRYDEYDEYLENHINNVKKSWNEVLRPQLEDKLSKPEIDEITATVSEHDVSKYGSDEYVPYLNHFYPADGKKVDDDNDVEFDKAWLLHQHRNPHHWQYWVLVKDSGDMVPMDMPLKYICEMLCDWHSFSAKYPESTAKAWYNDNKDKMKFSDKTREMVEEYIDYFENPLK